MSIKIHLTWNLKGKDMSKVRLSFDIDSENHKRLKLCCVNMGISIKEFALCTILNNLNQIEQKQREKESNSDK